MQDILSLNPYGTDAMATGLQRGQQLSNMLTDAQNYQILKQTAPGLIQARNAQNAYTTQTMPIQANIIAQTAPGEINAKNAQNAYTVNTLPGQAQMVNAKNNLLSGNPLLGMDGIPQSIGVLNYLSSDPRYNGQQPSAPVTQDSAAINPAYLNYMMQAPGTQQGAPPALQVSNNLGQPTQQSAQGMLGNVNLPQLGLNNVIGQLMEPMARSQYYNALSGSMATREMPVMQREQTYGVFQALGYPNAVTAQVLNNPALASRLMAGNVSYKDFVAQGYDKLLQSPGVGGGIMPLSYSTPSSNYVFGQQPNNQLSGGNQLTPAQQSASDLAKQQGSETQSNVITKTAPASILTQRAIAGIAGSLYNQANAYIPAVSQYAGYKGSVDQLVDSLKSGVNGEPDPNYNQLLLFKQTVIPLANEIRRQLGGQATDNETAILGQLTDPSITSKSPQQVLQLWQNLGQMLNTTGAQLAKNNAQILPQLGNEANVQNFTTMPGQNQQPQIGWQSDGTYLAKNGQRYTHAQLLSMQGGK